LGLTRHSFFLAFSSAVEVVLEDLGALEVGVFLDLALQEETLLGGLELGQVVRDLALQDLVRDRVVGQQRDTHLPLVLAFLALAAKSSDYLAIGSFCVALRSLRSHRNQVNQIRHALWRALETF
jgi:hypothetical protein